MEYRTTLTCNRCKKLYPVETQEISDGVYSPWCTDCLENQDQAPDERATAELVIVPELSGFSDSELHTLWSAVQEERVRRDSLTPGDLFTDAQIDAATAGNACLYCGSGKPNAVQSAGHHQNVPNPFCITCSHNLPRQLQYFVRHPEQYPHKWHGRAREAWNRLAKPKPDMLMVSDVAIVAANFMKEVKPCKP